MNLLCPELILAATAVCQLIMIVIRLGCTLRSLMITHYTTEHRLFALIISFSFDTVGAVVRLVLLLITTTSAANRLIGEVVQSRRRPLLGSSPG